MAKLSRRDFLKIGAAGVGAITLYEFLTACGQTILPTATPVSPTDTPVSPTNTRVSPTNTEVATNTAPPPEATSTIPPPTETPRIIPDVAVARGGEPEDLVRRALAALGGMEKFVPRGANVIVKPNICVDLHTYEYAATTNPWVVGTLVKMCFEAGAGSVKVMDYPFDGTAEKAYKISGIKDQVEAAGGEMVYMSILKYALTDIPNAVQLKQVNVFGDILTADVLINVPIAKQHSSTRLTLGMKNLMGVILDRSALHVGNLGQHITDLNCLVRPKLTVVDAIRILTANGPTGGNLEDVKELDTIIASPDIVAADSVATTLFGLQPDDIAYIKIGTSMGLGRSDLQNLNIETIPAT